MSRFSLRKLAAFLPVLAFTACTRPPALPELPHTGPTPVQRVVLHDTITPADVRNLFGAVNADGKLDSLKPYIEAPDDKTLADIGDLISRYFYRDAQSDRSLAGFVRDGIAKKKFTSFRKTIARWESTGNAAAEREAALYVLALDIFPTLVSRDVVLVDSEWGDITGRMLDQARQSELFSRFVPGASPAPELIVSDLGRFLGDAGTRQKFLALGGTLIEKSFGRPLLSAFGQARAESGTTAFRGLGEGIKGMLAPANDLQGLLKLVRLLDGPPDGLFKVPQEKLKKEPDTMRDFALYFQPMIAQGTSGFLRETLTKGPAGNTRDRFIAIRTGIEQIAGASRSDDASDYFLFNLPIYLNTYALERWLDAVRKDPANKAVSARIESEGFPEAIWDSLVVSPALNLDLIGRDAHGEYHIAAGVKSDFAALGLDPYAALLDTAVKQDGLGNFSYRFTKGAKPMKLSEALGEAVRLCDKVRPFADPSSFIRATVYRLTRAANGAPTLFESFESPDINVMDLVNGLLDFAGAGKWPQLKKLLFEDIKLGNLDPDTRKILLTLYDDAPALHAKVEEMLSLIKTFEAFDRAPASGLPTAFAMYQRVLAFLPREERHQLPAVLSFASDVGLAASEANGKNPRYPAFYGFLSEGSPLARMTYSLGCVEPRDRAKLLSVVETVLGDEGLEQHTNLVQSLVGLHPAAVASWIKRAQDAVTPGTGESAFPELSLDEKQWLSRFVRDGDHKRLWDFLSRHGSRASLHALAGDLLRLSSQGYLREAMRLLAQVQNERIQEISRILARWDESGELKQLLEAAQILLKP